MEHVACAGHPEDTYLFSRLLLNKAMQEVPGGRAFWAGTMRKDFGKEVALELSVKHR